MVVDPDRVIGPPHSWPLAVRRALEQRADALVARWVGEEELVDLGAPGVLDEVLERAGAEPFTGDAAYVLSVGALSLAADLHRALCGVAAHLAPDGILLAVEPVGTPGWRGLLFGSVGTAWPVARRFHLQRDVPFTVRRAGFEILDLDRFTLDTRCWPLRHAVALRARRTRPVPAHVQTAQGSRRHRPDPSDEVPGGTT